ncbi:MAG: NADP-dependent oxidoreductase [Candidatus Binatia bacterium]
MDTAVNRQYRLKARPEGRIKPGDFELVRSEVPKAGPGEAVARQLYLSLDPTNRIWMADVEQYMPPVQLGEVMRGIGLAQVVESKSPRYAVGDLVSGLTGWQDYVLINAGNANMLTPVPKGLDVPPQMLLGVLGLTGLTAYFGLLEIGQPKEGETVVISAAAGATGSVAGQIAKIKSCRAVGIAGGAEKCRWLVDELGFDAAIDYRAAGWQERLRAACPNGVDINFENVGGEIMDTVMSLMNLHGRVVLCGLISGYNAGEPMRGRFDLILMKRLRAQGFIVTDFIREFPSAVFQLVQWHLEGKLKHRDTVIDGLEQAPTAINMLFDGGNVGKLLIKVADRPLA